MSTTNNSSSLPPGWVLADLSAIAQINPPLDRCVVSDAVQVNFIPMKAVEPEGGGLAHPETCTYGEVKKGYTPFLSGDVIMAKITPCMENGKTAVVPDLPDSVCFGSTEFHVFRPEHDVSPQWLSYYLLQSNFRKFARRNMAGSAGQLRVPAPFLHTIKIPLAPLAEQQRILEKVEELLSDIDTGIVMLERVRKKLSHYRTAVLKAAVEGTLTAKWRQQHADTEPASELLKRILEERRRRWEEEQLRKFAEIGKAPPKNWKSKYKEPVAPDVSNLPILPEGWIWTTVEAICSKVVDCPHSTPDWTSDGYICVRTTNFRPGLLDLSEVRYVSLETYNQRIERLKPESGDILYSREGGILGIACNVPVGVELCLGQRMMLMRVSADLPPGFLMHVLNSPRIQVMVNRLTGGSASPHLNVSDIKQFTVPLPPLHEQQQIVAEVEDQLSIIEHVESDVVNKLKATHALRQSILRDAFNGRLIPQNPNDEPAAELLKRIAAEREERQLQAISTKRSSVKMKQSRKRAAAI